MLVAIFQTFKLDPVIVDVVISVYDEIPTLAGVYYQRFGCQKMLLCRKARSLEFVSCGIMNWKSKFPKIRRSQNSEKMRSLGCLLAPVFCKKKKKLETYFSKHFFHTYHEPVVYLLRRC